MIPLGVFLARGSEGPNVARPHGDGVLHGGHPSVLKDGALLKPHVAVGCMKGFPDGPPGLSCVGVLHSIAQPGLKCCRVGIDSGAGGSIADGIEVRELV